MLIKMLANLTKFYEKGNLLFEVLQTVFIMRTSSLHFNRVIYLNKTTVSAYVKSNIVKVHQLIPVFLSGFCFVPAYNKAIIIFCITSQIKTVLTSFIRTSLQSTTYIFLSMILVIKRTKWRKFVWWLAMQAGKLIKW